MGDGPGFGIQEALGQSEAFLAFQERLSRAAQVDRPVLLVGERGTGKELASSRLHYLSSRWQGPLLALNCAALTPSLVESELFGHEAGAFTGAARLRRGRFEEAHQGTLLLDEIGLIPLEVQEKILRVVEYGLFERVGGSKPVEVDVRIVGATNADLRLLAGQGRFKQDLLDRLSFEVLLLPPLRERKGDVPLLAHFFAARMARELGWALDKTGPPRFSPRALAALEAHPWPGNIRELKNVVERAVYRSGQSPIEEVVFDPFGPGPALAPTPGQVQEAGAIPQTEDRAGEKPASSFSETIRLTEQRLLKSALVRTRYNQRRAAELLELTYDQLRGLIRKHGGLEALSG